MDLREFYDENVKIEDVKGNIIECYVFDYDKGDEEDEDSEYFNVPYIWVENVKVIKGKEYYNGCTAIFYEEDIKSIEIIK